MPDTRRLLHLLVVLHVIGSTQGLLFVQGMFALRRDYVAERLCVNRDVPEADCHGRCFLEERLDEQRREQERQAGLELQLAVTFYLPVDDAPPAPPVRRAPPYVLAGATGLPVERGGDVFHPPRVA